MHILSKLNNILFYILMMFALLYFGAPFLIPFIFGLLFASLVTPLAEKIESFGINRIISSVLTTLLVFVITGTLLLLFVYQVDRFITEMPSFRDELQGLIKNIQSQIATLTNLSLEEQSNIWQDKSGELLSRIEPLVTNFVGGLLNSIFSFLLVLIYMFLLLLYRDKIYGFILNFTRKNNTKKSKKILKNSNKVVFHYLWGRVKVMGILGVLYYITFLLFGLPYAVLLTIFGSIITIIPYLGPFISGLIPIIFSFVFFDGIQKVVLFSSIIIIIQLIESYLLEPMIIGKEVKLNPLIVIIAVVIGGLIWGMAGMILLVPLFAMLKIILTNTPGLEPIAFLFGNSSQDISNKKL
jgi:predicted PurR-regulated permease PerM